MKKIYYLDEICKKFPIILAARPKSFSVFNLALAAALIGLTKNLFRASKLTCGMISKEPEKLKRILYKKIEATSIRSSLHLEVWKTWKLVQKSSLVDSKFITIILQLAHQIKARILLSRISCSCFAFQKIFKPLTNDCISQKISFFYQEVCFLRVEWLKKTKFILWKDLYIDLMSFCDP